MGKYVNIYCSNEKFKVNNIFCIGKNYLDHIKEFGQTEAPEKPVIFLKPNSAILSDGSQISVPEINGKKISDNVHYETEMVVAIGKDGLNIHEENVNDYIFGYGIGLDLTLRDVQAEAKKAGLPWGTAKGFYGSAPVSDIIPKAFIENPMELDIEFKLNNIRKQFSNTKLMILNIYKLISHISTVFGIAKGDLIFTGTPEGVGELSAGDELHARLSELVELKVRFNG